jgi:phage I-like protein
VTASKAASIAKTGLTLIAGAMIGAAGMWDIAAFSSEGAVPDKVLLMPFGSNMLGDGRGPFVLRDRAHAETVVAATKEKLGNREFMFDYDHQGMKVIDESYSGKAVAAGWTKDFAVDDKGIWAVEVQWTPAAKTHIAAHEYRYISPWFMASKKTGEVALLINAALVNRPAFDLEAIAASLSEENSQLETEDMSLKAIAAALGLAEDADQAAIIAAIGKNNETQTAIAAALQAKDGDDLAAVAAGLVTKANAAKKDGDPDPKEFVPIAAFQELQTKVATLSGDRNDGLVAAAIREGKISPAQKDWAASFLTKHGETEFSSYIASAPKIIGDRVAPKGDPANGEHVLDDADQSIAAALGITDAEDLKAFGSNLKKEA